MRTRILLSALCLLGCAAVSSASTSSSDSIDDLASKSLEELGEYKVNAPTRTTLALAETPGSVSVFTYDQIHNNSAQTIPDLMRLVPGVNVRWNPMVETIDVRSFGSTPFSGNVLFMIDGVPYNSWDKGGFPEHPGFDFFNLQNVKHIEIIRGGGSALYGENAYNGVINIVTLSGEELNQTTLEVTEGNLATRSASFIHGSRLGDDGSILISARRKHGDLPYDLWTQSAKGGTNGDDFYVKGKYDDFQISAYRRSDDTAGFVHSEGPPLLPPGSGFQSAAHISQRIDIYAGQYEHASADDRWSVKVNASRQSRYGTSCSACHDALKNPLAGTVEKDGYENFANVQLGLRLLRNHDVLFGTEIRKLSAGGDPSETSGQPDSTPAGGGGVVSSYRKQAMYIQDRVTALDDRASLVAGLRYDSPTTPRQFGSHLFPRVAAVYAPLERLTLRANWGQAARYPTFTEQYAATGFLSASTPAGLLPLASFKPNPNLRPELSTETDAGVEYHVTSHLQAKIDLYQKRLRDYIDLSYTRALLSTVQFVNYTNEAQVRGVELELRGDIAEGWNSFINYSLQRNTQFPSGSPSSGGPIEFTYAPHNKLNAGITWSATSALHTTLDVSWKDHAMAPAFWYPIAFPLDPSVRPLPAYTNLNAHLSYSLPWLERAGHRPLTLTLNGRNLLNQRVEETLTGLSGTLAGRTLYVGVQYDVTH